MKTTFAKIWGSFAYTLMPFRLKNGLGSFSKIVIEAFKDFIYRFLEVYLDDWRMFSLLKYHIHVLILILDRCRQLHISLNLNKCIYFLHPLEFS